MFWQGTTRGFVQEWGLCRTVNKRGVSPHGSRLSVSSGPLVREEDPSWLLPFKIPVSKYTFFLWCSNSSNYSNRSVFGTYDSSPPFSSLSPPHSLCRFLNEGKKLQTTPVLRGRSTTSNVVFLFVRGTRDLGPNTDPSLDGKRRSGPERLTSYMNCRDTRVFRHTLWLIKSQRVFTMVPFTQDELSQGTSLFQTLFGVSWRVYTSECSV